MDSIIVNIKTLCDAPLDDTPIGAKSLGAKSLGAKSLGAKSLGAKSLGDTPLGDTPLGELKPLKLNTRYCKERLKKVSSCNCLCKYFAAGLCYTMLFSFLIICYVGTFMLVAWLIFGRPHGVEKWSHSPANPIQGLPEYPINFMIWVLALLFGICVSCSLVQLCCGDRR